MGEPTDAVTREEFAKLQADLRTLARVVYDDLPFADRIYEQGKELHPDQRDALAVLQIARPEIGGTK